MTAIDQGEMMSSSQHKGNSELSLIVTGRIQMMMGGSEAEQVCKNHPYHHHKQGVCASCLRERLSQLIYFKTSQASILASSSSSSSLSSSPDLYSSANSNHDQSRRRCCHQRNISDNNMGIMAAGSLSFRLSVGNRLKKSRSIAFVARNHVGDQVKNGKKKSGFWTKLLHLKGKKDQVLVRSAVSMNGRLYN